jgi:hypothetical protein
LLISTIKRLYLIKFTDATRTVKNTSIPISFIVNFVILFTTTLILLHVTALR